MSRMRRMQDISNTGYTPTTRVATRKGLLFILFSEFIRRRAGPNPGDCSDSPNPSATHHSAAHNRSIAFRGPAPAKEDCQRKETSRESAKSGRRKNQRTTTEGRANSSRRSYQQRRDQQKKRSPDIRAIAPRKHNQQITASDCPDRFDSYWTDSCSGAPGDTATGQARD